MKKELEKMEEVLNLKGTYNLRKDSFDIEVSKESSDSNKKLKVWYNVLVKCEGDVYGFYDGLPSLENVSNVIEELSESSKEFKRFKKKQSLTQDIKEGKYKSINNNSVDLEDIFVRIYKGDEGDYDFNGLLDFLEKNLKKDEILDFSPGSQITASISSIRNATNNNLYSKEIELIENQLNKKVCGHCKCTVINANNIHYVDYSGCVGKAHICPDCLELHSIKMLSLLSKLPDNATNIDRVQAISYIYSELEKCD